MNLAPQIRTKLDTATPFMLIQTVHFHWGLNPTQCVRFWGPTAGVVLGFKSGRPDGEDECLGEGGLWWFFETFPTLWGFFSSEKNTDGMMVFEVGCSLHPQKLTWNLKIDPSRRRFLLGAIIFRFHVSF